MLARGVFGELFWFSSISGQVELGVGCVSPGTGGWKAWEGDEDRGSQGPYSRALTFCFGEVQNLLCLWK